MADFQDILARLTANSSEAQSPGSSQAQNNPIWASAPSLQQRQGYHQPSVSSPIFDPSPAGPQPIHSSAIMSPNVPGSASATPAPEGANRANLLNLLKFAQPGQQSAVLERRSSSGLWQNPQLERGRTPAGAEQAASFVSKPSLASLLSKPETKGESAAASSDNPQDFLLKLLNQPRPSQPSSIASLRGGNERDPSEDQAVGAASNDKIKEMVQRTSDGTDLVLPDTVRMSEIRDAPSRSLFGGEGIGNVLASQPNPPINKSSIFNYVNPFEQLSASSPRKQASHPESQKELAEQKVDLPKHGRDLSSGAHDKLDFGTQAPVPKSRKLSPGASREASAREQSAIGEVRTSLEGIIGVGPKKGPQETVSQALNDVGEQANKQVEEAMSQLNIGVNGRTQHENEKVLKSEKGIHDLADEMQDVAKEMQEGLKDEDVKADFEKSVPADVAQAVEETVEDLAQGHIPDDWEDVDDHTNTDPHRVFTFPMKPFVSIEVQPSQGPKPGVRESGIMDIARFKKDFDQLDRNLAMATKNYIAYAALKHGGFRLIHQGSGKDKHVFRGPSNADRIFNLAICSGTPPSQYSDIDAIIATGLDGSIFWTAVNKSRGDSFDEDDLTKEGFILPPTPATDDNTSGSQLKTRAKPSSRHTEYFAVGRGKSIYIIWPYTARTGDFSDLKTRLVDTSRYFDKHHLVIHTHKAAKDFAFSEDDTVIVSLDKAGKMKFWDIREMVDSLSSVPVPPQTPMEIKVPKLTFLTTPPNEKSWPTSIMFVDKERPYLRGGAIRYLIVGLKQNHTLQLWDLGLRKVVQELSFPHNNETDPICSLAYHPRTSVLVLAHPTRNSIFLIQLSCPRYNLSHMSQAKYIQRLAANDPQLPQPESTAIMSGVREISFASKGQLRSIGMQNNPITEAEGGDENMFELYVMHSKGVTCFTVTKGDIGWGKDNKNISPVNGEEEGFIIVRELQPLPSAAPSEPSVNGDTLTPVSVQKRSAKSSRASRTATPEPSVRGSSRARMAEKQEIDRPAAANAPEKKKPQQAAEESKRSAEAAKIDGPAPTYASAVQRTEPLVEATKASPEKSKSKAPPEKSSTQEDEPVDAAAEMATANISKLTKDLFTEFSGNVSHQLENLHRRLDEDKRIQDAAGNAKQDAVLRLVSSTLTENVEKSLNRIVSTSVQQSLLPAISDVTTKTLNQKLPQIINEQTRNLLPKEIKSSLPAALSLAMQNQNVLRTISESITEKINGQVDRHLQTTINKTLLPSLNRAVAQETQIMSSKIESNITEQLRKADLQHAQDNQKIDQLASLVRELSGTVRAMATAQGNFQNEITKLQGQIQQQQASAQKPIGHERATSRAAATAVEPEGYGNQPKPSPEDEELRAITALLQDGQFEEGTIRWLQSPHQSILFPRLFCRVNPSYVSHLTTPLIALSCAAAVTTDFDTHVTERLNWLETVLSYMENHYRERVGSPQGLSGLGARGAGFIDDDLRDVCPKIMDVLSQRLQALYMRYSEGPYQGDAVLHRIAGAVRRALKLGEEFGGDGGR
ncbi:MAG: hypothetical protein M1820_005960 [Bogoriella megaspora]|nr:MAG: hypothetical protein M1820_005960 [Bogoriella megaspora]